MLNLGLGSYDAINVAGQQSVDLGLGLGLASINNGGSGGDNSAVLDALGNLNFPDYSSTLQSIMDEIGGISIPNYQSKLDEIISRLNAGVTTWVAGVNCIGNQGGGVISVGSSSSTFLFALIKWYGRQDLGGPAYCLIDGIDSV